jgi:hypothetical protein
MLSKYKTTTAELMEENLRLKSKTKIDEENQNTMKINLNDEQKKVERSAKDEAKTEDATKSTVTSEIGEIYTESQDKSTKDSHDRDHMHLNMHLNQDISIRIRKLDQQTIDDWARQQDENKVIEIKMKEEPDASILSPVDDTEYSFTENSSDSGLLVDVSRLKRKSALISNGSETKKAKIGCPYQCGTTFASVPSQTRHTEVNQIEPTYSSLTFIRIFFLIRFQTIHEGWRYVCSVCGLNDRRKDKLKKMHDKNNCEGKTNPNFYFEYKQQTAEENPAHQNIKEEA